MNFKLCKCNCGNYFAATNLHFYIQGHKPKTRSLCVCGCGEYSNVGRQFISGHNRRGKGKLLLSHLCNCGCGKQANPGRKFFGKHKTHKTIGPRIFCGCNCGQLTSPGKRFINHHFSKVEWTQERRERLRQAALGNQHTRGQKRSDKTKALMRQNSLGKKATPMQKEKAKERALKQWEDGVHDNNQWMDRHESYPEKIFREFLESLGAVKGVDFFQEYQVKRYKLDFVFIDELGKRNIEIDGSQHNTQKAKEHDKIRDEKLQEYGWITLRLTPKELYMMLDKLKNRHSGLV